MDFAVAAPLFYAKEAEMPLGPSLHPHSWFDAPRRAVPARDRAAIAPSPWMQGER